MCVEELGSYSCDCNEGYELDTVDGKICNGELYHINTYM